MAVLALTKTWVVGIFKAILFSAVWIGIIVYTMLAKSKFLRISDVVNYGIINVCVSKLKKIEDSLPKVA